MFSQLSNYGISVEDPGWVMPFHPFVLPYVSERFGDEVSPSKFTDS